MVALPTDDFRFRTVRPFHLRKEREAMARCGRLRLGWLGIGEETFALARSSSQWHGLARCGVGWFSRLC